MHSGSIEHWEIALRDIQGKMSSLHFWPSTMTCACIKFQVLRGNTLEHEELTPFFPVIRYELKCDFRFTMDIPRDCTQIRLALISGDIHPISGKPKLIARSRLSVSEVRRHCPLHKYFSLYRWDQVTESNVPGGHIRLDIHCNRGTDLLEEEFFTYRSSSSLDRVSICSSRVDAFSVMRSCDSDISTIPQRAASTIPQVCIYPGTHTKMRSSSSTYSDLENADSVRLNKTDSASRYSTGRSEVYSQDEPFQGHSSARQLTMGSFISGEQTGNSLYRHEETNELSGNSKVSDGSSGENHHHSPRDANHKVIWFGIIVGTTLGVLGTVAAFTLRCLSRKKSEKRRSGDFLLSSGAY